jgi:hypothetical protein
VDTFLLDWDRKQKKIIRRLTWRRAGLPDGLFSNQNPILGKFWRVLFWKILVYFMATVYNCQLPIGKFNGHLLHFVVIWYIFFSFWFIVPRKIWQPWRLASGT